ncbi:MAG: hypothetical protein ACK414_12430, partial [Gemmobacter sp.]
LRDARTACGHITLVGARLLGLPQIVTGVGPDGIPNTADDIVVEGNLSAPVNTFSVGAIRIGQGETYFQIPRSIAAKFADAAARTGLCEDDEETPVIERSDTGPREAARTNRQMRPSRSGADKPFVKAKPAGKRFARKPNGPSGAPGAKPWHGKKPGPARPHRHQRKQS